MWMCPTKNFEKKVAGKKTPLSSYDKRLRTNVTIAVMVITIRITDLTPSTCQVVDKVNRTTTRIENVISALSQRYLSVIWRIYTLRGWRRFGSNSGHYKSISKSFSSTWKLMSLNIFKLHWSENVMIKRKWMWNMSNCKPIRIC